MLRVSSDSSTSLVISDASVKNNITTSISHIHMHNKPVIKTLYCAMNITSTKAKLLAIHCGINQFIGLYQINKIIVITDSLHAAKIFKSLIHSYQIHSAAISHELREFFMMSNDNHIEFWDCPSNIKWPLYLRVDNKTKTLTLTPIFPHKSLWDYCSKHNSDSITAQWRMLFQALDSKEKNFLDLLDDNLNPIEPSAIRSSPWLQHFGYSNSLCAQAT